MVPVPEEFAEEFGVWLLAHTMRAGLSAWPPGAIESTFEQADQQMKVAMAALARREGIFVPAEEIASVVEVEVAQLVELLGDLSDHCFARSLPPMVMVKTEGDGTEESPLQHSLLMGADVRAKVRMLVGAS
jgi:hypothetical protein